MTRRPSAAQASGSGARGWSSTSANKRGLDRQALVAASGDPAARADRPLERIDRRSVAQDVSQIVAQREGLVGQPALEQVGVESTARHTAGTARHAGLGDEAAPVAACARN